MFKRFRMFWAFVFCAFIYALGSYKTQLIVLEHLSDYTESLRLLRSRGMTIEEITEKLKGEP